MSATAFAARAGTLRRDTLETLQLNLGRYCNLACTHCHVEAGPKRTEMMDPPTARRIAAWLGANRVQNLDLTGGAPELNAQFRFLVETGRAMGLHVMDRCNLTVLFEPGQSDLAEFLAGHRVEVIASLPCYSADNVDQQRGNRVFEQSIAALRQLNQLGYGQPAGGLLLNLVYNPVGAYLPPAQAALEARYRQELSERYGIVFNRLFTITNMPIRRFRHYLQRIGQFDIYNRLLSDNFNASTLAGLMCRTLVSVDWQGRLYDCDFNQMLDLAAPGTPGRFLWEYAAADLIGRPIATGEHCFGCTAGSGSSCGGALAP
ncbi:arsenosugar biosynthesis radical SAM (seleno)protein ArsS [Gloeobacter morelensis]|uniref:Arsenosugar biosynthesis radical SAM protein ArsS n=1 Tax=Gloeobacter morelensis MG652769 TaxID=2781736 RepID=A0ABY3PQW2_9CYAN|nr:arsenosugar biosynthesis radical SAM (seleno)protein ArsS [Gloeobacter morelensis]UFP96103.1 arsenosugar biosynthesis radical SAM protein ArsS [Gloeobacter morelensis MG652769]